MAIYVEYILIHADALQDKYAMFMRCHCSRLSKKMSFRVNT